jgi:hypothetical protein
MLIYSNLFDLTPAHGKLSLNRILLRGSYRKCQTEK